MDGNICLHFKVKRKFRVKGSLMAGAAKRMERGARLLCALPMGAAAMVGMAGPAQAQSVSFNPDYGRSGQFLRRFDVAVAQRPQPQFDAVPIRLDSFDLLATASAAVEPNDNIYAVENDRKADLVTSLSASADIASDWSRHGVRAFARGSVIRYLDNSTENVDVYGVGASGFSVRLRRVPAPTTPAGEPRRRAS